MNKSEFVETDIVVINKCITTFETIKNCIQLFGKIEDVRKAKKQEVLIYYNRK